MTACTILQNELRITNECINTLQEISQLQVEKDNRYESTVSFVLFQQYR